MQSGQTDKRIFVGTNEIVAQQVLNRVFRQLVSSDLENLNLYNSEISGLRIHEYGDLEGGYDIGDVVWLPGDGNQQDSYILRSVRNGNLQDPRQAFSLPYVDNEPDFYRLGWKNLNYTPSISSSGTYSAIQDCVDSTFSTHETDQVLHRYSEISPDSDSGSYVFGKIAMTDMSNVRNDREQIFFPFQTGHFTSESVLNGIYRIWDNGYLEMDIVFRLGKVGSDSDTPVISANNVSFQYSSTFNTRSTSYNSNVDYFMDKESLDIFNVEGSQVPVKVGNIVQVNRNDYVNTYFAEIDFTKFDIKNFVGNGVLGFADTNYMIFKVDTMCQTRDLRSGSFNPAANTMTFTNRTRNGFTVVYVTFPEQGKQEYRDEGTRNGGLAANSFSCRVVGRWK